MSTLSLNNQFTIYVITNIFILTITIFITHKNHRNISLIIFINT
nr:MAG TPA: hypothetical protein [Caudoviricetes sp.]